jgi:predicted flap endonuclease-1-like 5' DNA nuclease
MGRKAFLQRGRGKPGLVLPANAVAKINEARNRSALVRAAEVLEPAPPPDDEPDTKPDARPFDEPTIEEPAVDEPTVEEPVVQADDLKRIIGVGPRLEKRLHSFGYESFAQLADADADELNAITGVNGRGASFVDQARSLRDA